MLVFLVAPRVFRAPEGPAAREARRPHFVRRRASKPARALRTLRRPPHQWGLLCSHVALPPPPPTGTAASPTPPPSPRTPSPYWDPVPHPQTLTSLIPEPTRNFACNSPETISNLQFRSLELQRFQTLLELLSIELHATFRGQTPNTTTGTAAWHLTHD